MKKDTFVVIQAHGNTFKVVKTEVDKVRRRLEALPRDLRFNDITDKQIALLVVMCDGAAAQARAAARPELVYEEMPPRVSNLSFVKPPGGVQ